jgi:hypothetical protein
VCKYTITTHHALLLSDLIINLVMRSSCAVNKFLPIHLFKDLHFAHDIVIQFAAMSSLVKQTVVFRCPPRMKAQLAQLAEDMEVTVSDVIRLCIRGEINNLKERFARRIDEDDSPVK